MAHVDIWWRGQGGGIIRDGDQDGLHGLMSGIALILERANLDPQLRQFLRDRGFQLRHPAGEQRRHGKTDGPGRFQRVTAIVESEEVHEAAVPLRAVPDEHRFQHIGGQVIAQLHDAVGAPIDWSLNGSKTQFSVHITLRPAVVGSDTVPAAGPAYALARDRRYI